MGYFSKFPIIYPYKFNNLKMPCIDITKRSSIVEKYKRRDSNHIEYTIRDGDTPLTIADKIYDDADLFWVIPFYNNIMDLDDDWPLKVNELRGYISDEYGNSEGVHHYESMFDGRTVESDHPEYDRITITNYEYEYRKNENKRSILVPIPEIARAIKNEHDRLMRS
tara:strand:- start:13243 stop:13740 length:498 start_codon:yes stop_codon:yes gene_type:complete